jgi:hypothetical protein
MLLLRTDAEMQRKAESILAELEKAKGANQNRTPQSSFRGCLGSAPVGTAKPHPTSPEGIRDHINAIYHKSSCS